MIRFFHEMLEQKRAPARALCAASRWLRDAPFSEVKMMLADASIDAAARARLRVRGPPPPPPGVPGGMQISALGGVKSEDSVVENALPYCEAYFHGSFVLIGADASLGAGAESAAVAAERPRSARRVDEARRQARKFYRFDT